MGAKKGSLGVTNKQSETPEIEGTTDVRSKYSSSKRILSSSASSSDDDRPNVITNHDHSGSSRSSVRPEVKAVINEPRLADLERNGVYDREAILKYLAKLARSPNGGEFIYDIIGLNKGFAGSLIDELRESFRAVPDSTLHMLTGMVSPGDCGRPADQKPEWLDMEKLQRGQKFTHDYEFPVLYSTLVGLLPAFSLDNLRNPLIFTGKSITPFTSFRRYLSTALRFRRWYTQDYLTNGTVAWNDVSLVRAMHTAARKRLEASTNEEMDAATAIPNAYCPTREMIMKDFGEGLGAPETGHCPFGTGRNSPNRPKGINQTEMAITQWSFVGMLILYPQSFGVHDAKDEELEGFCHLWRSLGYQLGIEDEHNFCRGTLEDIRQRSRDFIDTWVKPNLLDITPEWEHMSRSFVTGMATIVPCLTFEVAVVHFMETLGLSMPRLYASLSYIDRIKYNVLTGLLYYGMRVPGITRLTNAFANLMLDRAEKYSPDKLEALRIMLDE